MVVVRLENSLSLQLYTDRFRIQMSSKIPNRISNHVKVTAPVCRNLNLQNCTTSPQFQDKPFEKSSSNPLLTNNVPLISVSSTNNMIREYIEDGLFDDAIGVYLKMLAHGVPAVEFGCFPSLIKAFGGLCDEEKGRQIHGHVLKLGVLEEVSVVNSLLSMYWKCGAVEDAVQMFEKMPEMDLVSWNTMISGFQQSMDYVGSLMFFRRMVWEFGMHLTRVACVSALSSCSSLQSLIRGREIHGVVVKSQLDVDEFLVTALIEMYMKCGYVKNAENIFKSFLDKDAVSEHAVIWNVMISGYVSNGCFLQALALYVKMMAWGIRPDYSTIVALFVLCSESLDIAFGKQIHSSMIKFGLKNNVRVETALLDMYLKCGDLETGLKIFRSQNHNLVMWSALISNCAQGGCATKALELFHEFRIEDGLADSGILVAVLRACSSLTLKAEGMQIHGLATKLGFVFEVFVGSALVDMYAKCRDMEYSQKVLLRLSQRDLVSWNALISGYAQNECANEALKAFHDMQLEQIRPNTVTVACILSVCARLSIMIMCKEVHGYLIRQGFETAVLVSNSLISTYARCGDMNTSLHIFEKIPEKNDVSWNSIILGLGMHGHTDEMIFLYDKMIASGGKPDHLTFTAILSACSHAGKVDEGCKYFKSMVEDFNLEPRLEQYTCMVDLLGRAGHLNQAYDLIMAMPFAADDRIWGSLLGSCKSHGDERLADIVANRIFKFDPSSVGYRVLLSNLYRTSGKGREASKIRSEIKDMGLKKKPGCSWIEVKNKFHIFIAGDESHYQSDEIYAAIESLTIEIKRAGYIPQTHS